MNRSWPKEATLTVVMGDGTVMVYRLSHLLMEQEVLEGDEFTEYTFGGSSVIHHTMPSTTKLTLDATVEKQQIISPTSSSTTEE